jgi:hypothetical protein
MPWMGFETTIPASDRPQTDALDRAATGFGLYNLHSLPNLTRLSAIRMRRVGHVVRMGEECIQEFSVES